MKKLEKVFDVLGEIIAVVMALVYALWIINLNYHFLPAEVVNILAIAKEYGLLALVAVVGLEAMSKRNFIFRVIFYALVALVVIFLFFPGTYANLIGMVNGWIAG